MNFRQNIRRILRYKVRTKYLRLCAAAFGALALALLVFALVEGDFLSSNSYITGFTVQELANDGESLAMSGADGKSLVVSRSEVGPDSYFRVKKAVQKGEFVRASVYKGRIWEFQSDGESLIRPAEDADKHLFLARTMANAALFCLGICAILILGVYHIRKSRRSHGRKNKK